MAFKALFKDINLISWNANGITNKVNELEALTNEIKVEIICIQESKLNKRKPPKIRNFYYINKPKNIGGGLIIYYKKHLKPIEIQTHTVNSESQAIKINDLTIVNFYNGHQTPLDTDELDYLMNLDERVIIAGDYNCRNSSWNCTTSNTNGNLLKRYLDSTNYILNFPRNSYTYYPTNNNTPSTIDLMTTKNITITQPFTIQELDSDHFPVLTTIPKSNSSSLPKPKATYYTDWKKFKELINQNVKMNNNLHTTDDIDNCIRQLTKIIKLCLHHSTITTNTQKYHYLKIPPHVQELIKIKNKLRKRLQRNHSMSLFQQYKDSVNLVRATLNSLKTEEWEKFTKNLTNSDEMWRIARSLKNNSNPSGISTLHGPHGLIFDEESKAEHLAENYSKIHNSTRGMSDRQTERTVDERVLSFINSNLDTPPDHSTSPNEIRQIIKALKNKKAPGEDKISNLTLKHLPRKAIVQLNYIFNSCLKLCYFPNSWKNAIVLSFPKPKKDPKFASNYRPISLLPTMSKVLEKIILNNIKNHENDYNEIIDEQYGFRTSHSTVLQLATITDLITKNFNYKKITAMLNLDIEKAFDTVWHNGLIYKLLMTKLPPHIIKIIHSYLQGRTYQVRVEKILSTKYSISAGVPQGGLLSPTLFNYYINDIPKTPQTKIKIFADDTAILSESSDPNYANKYIQAHVNELEKYYNKWKIKINAKKTTLTHFTQKRKTPPISIKVKFNGELIHIQNSVKYLGVTLDKKLSFNEHLGNISRKCYTILNKIFPLISKNSKLSRKSKLRVFKQGIRPAFLYANPIWSKISDTNYKKLQRLQNKFLRIILNKNRYTSIKQLHELGQTETIQETITKQTKKFFNLTTNKLDKTKYLGTTTSQNTNIKLKHRLIHHLILT